MAWRVSTLPGIASLIFKIDKFCLHIRKEQKNATFSYKTRNLLNLLLQSLKSLNIKFSRLEQTPGRYGIFLKRIFV